MDINEYFKELSEKFGKALEVAEQARKKGYDPEEFVEIKPAPDLAARVEGIINMPGIAERIRSKKAKSRQELAFTVANEICTDNAFEMEAEKRLTIAVRVGLAILTEGILVAPTEGFQGIKLYKNSDGTDYAAIIYAGPIRGAGGTSTALSVALADSCRRILGIGSYKITNDELERYVEEIAIYNSRIARLQYYPSEDNIRTILKNCPVCIDGLPIGDIEVSVHRDIKRTDNSGKEETITNRIRGGVPLVICEGIAQKAKSVLKHTKNAGLDWSWLNNIITVDKIEKKPEENHVTVFLQELVAGRPVLAYPNYPGSFRLRYGRSRFTGIAAKGFSPATMLILDEFIAMGTQLKVEKPGKGCIAMPVDSIEGPFVKLNNGKAFRINSAEDALKYKKDIKKILAVGDILITLGDFRKTNTVLQPTSYVEEYWYEQLKANGYDGLMPKVESFSDAYALSKKYGVPLHPRYLYDYEDISIDEAKTLSRAIAYAIKDKEGTAVDELHAIDFKEKSGEIVPILERLCIPHEEKETTVVYDDDAQSLVTTFGFNVDDKISAINKVEASEKNNAIDALNDVAPFKIMMRSVRIGGRIGRPEKARERLMRPAPNGLFPIGEYGGKERSLMKAYLKDKKRLGPPNMTFELARYVCSKNGEELYSNYCYKHKARAYIEGICSRCGRKGTGDKCSVCGGTIVYSKEVVLDFAKLFEEAEKRLGVSLESKAIVKGVKGMINKAKNVEPLEKAILRSIYGVSTFKDGTIRFDATDAPITHFYPSEIGTSVEKLRELGYTEDYKGNKLESPEQLVELKHQDVILNKRGANYLLKATKFIDALLTKFYGIDAFYNANSINDLVGQYVVTLSPHTSAGVLARIIGFTDANVGLAHPYLITARRRNCDGDEDTTMLLLDALINFSKSYLPASIGGTMDAPLILTVNVNPNEVDDEVWEMETIERYGKEFYDKTFEYAAPGSIDLDRVEKRLNSDAAYSNLMFTHESSASAIHYAPKQSMYTQLKSMQEKIEEQFSLVNRLSSVDKADTARKLILSHFIPDLIGNMHSFSKQTFRCISCNAKYRRVPLIGKCTKCGGKLVLTISKGGIEKYLNIAIGLADRYGLEDYIKQRLQLIKKEVEATFGNVGAGNVPVKQFNLANYM